MQIDRQFEVLARAMDAAAARQRVTAANIANVNTPGYVAREVAFEEEFAAAIARGDAEGAAHARIRVQENETAEVKSDGNSVHLEHEFGVLQKNQLVFNSYSSILQHKIQMMRRAIAGR